MTCSVRLVYKANVDFKKSVYTQTRPPCFSFELLYVPMMTCPSRLGFDLMMFLAQIALSVFSLLKNSLQTSVNLVVHLSLSFTLR